MGLRFRKSKKLGPLRINLSGSGIGWSIGGKHFRYTQPAKGKAHTTTTLPGTGISSRQTVQAARPVSPPRNASPQTAPQSAPQDTPKRSGVLLPVLIGLIVGGLILAGMQFVGSLSGYTAENMIPPPPDRTAQMSAAETETDAAPETSEPAVLLALPETAAPETEPPETEAPEAAPETEAAVVLPLEPEPAETTLEEWFAIVEARVRPRAYEPEEPDPDETTLDEWIEAHRAAAAADKRYTVNTKTKTIHAKDDCYAAKRIKSENVDYVADPYPLLADGYEWCGICH